MSSEIPIAASQTPSPCSVLPLTNRHKRLLRFVTSRNPELENQQLALVFIVYCESRVPFMNLEDITSKITEQLDVALPAEYIIEVQNKIGAVGRKLILDMLRELMKEVQGTAEENETKVEDGMSNHVAEEKEIDEGAVLSWFEEALKVYRNPSLLILEIPETNDG